MIRLLARMVPGLLTGLALVLIPRAARALDSEEVKFETADDVQLRGTFYAAQKAKAPCAVLLHKVGWGTQAGGDRTQPGWDKLVEELVKKDFAVLTFDFRGHGKSTSVGSDFWKVNSNLQLLRGANPEKKDIKYKDFTRDYLPMLVSDVAAAKRFLDKQNDAGVCNSSNVVIIGAEDGAAIGALWLACEWQRKPYVRNPNPLNATVVPWVVNPQGKPPGEDIAAAVWLSPTVNLNGQLVGQFFKASTLIRDKVPMVFLYSSGDAAGTTAAKSLFDTMKKSGKAPDLTFLREKKAAKARGHELLGKLDTEKDIAGFLEKVMDKRGQNAWKMREPDKGPPYTLVQLRPFFSIP